MIRVFVYGSLMSGEPNNTHLTAPETRRLGDLPAGAEARLVGEATTLPLFTLRDLGPFPCLTPMGETSVAGEVWEVNESMLARLDRLEGHPHLYQRTPIPLADGTTAEAYLRQYDDAPAVPSGSWKLHQQARAPWRRGVIR